MGQARDAVQRQADELLEAVACLRQGRRPIELAFACEDAGHLLARRRGRGRRRGSDRRGDHGVPPGWACRDVARLREHGVRRRGPAPARRPTVGLQALTETERRIASLAAQGLTNPEIGRRLLIFPRRTVDSRSPAAEEGGSGLRQRFVTLVSGHRWAGRPGRLPPVQPTSFVRRHFNRTVGVPPDTYRRSFRS